MKKLSLIYFIIIYFIYVSNSFGQDTTYIDNPSKYFSKNGDSERFDLTHRLKGYPRVKYSRELIRLSNNYYKIENCYYYDNKRYTNYYPTFYKFTNDSTIIVNKEKWHFKKINDSLYNVSIIDIDYIEKGTVSSLIPFTKQGDFVICNLKNRPMFIEKFGNGEYKTECVKYDLNDTIYTFVDKFPIFPKRYGDLKKYISERFRFPDIVRESAIQGTVFVRFVISSNGEVINLELLRGVNPFYDKEALRIITCLPNFEAGKLKGKNVNMYSVIPVKFMLD
ncbi:MAG: energy transducer TonB [Bacteroidales bacterium]|nr:energy transducer TonB [Bacteroidales bacterium]MBN2757107.1 energy transducer TonB [Bacteroidales bacterium]